MKKQLMTALSLCLLFGAWTLAAEPGDTRYQVLDLAKPEEASIINDPEILELLLKQQAQEEEAERAEQERLANVEKPIDGELLAMLEAGDKEFSVSKDSISPMGTSFGYNLLVKQGRIGHIDSSNYSDFGGGWKKWIALGNSNIGGHPSYSNIYGTKVQWQSDAVVFGLKNYGSDRKDAVIAWGDNSSDNLRFLRPNNKETMIITGSGRVGINRTNPSYKLDVNGGMRAQFITTWSDLRLKKDIAKLDGVLDKLAALEGVSYAWRPEHTTGSQGRHLGLIAQDVLKVFPEVVSKDEEGRLSVSYAQLVPVLVEAVKEEQKQIAEQRSLLLSQKEEITQLKEELRAFHTELAGLKRLMRNTDASLASK